MIKITIKTFALLTVVSSSLAQSKVLVSQEMESELLSTSVNYSVYLPDEFESSDAEYPVVYLLNGFTGDETDWIKYGHLKDIADQLIRSNKILPMVIIMPDGDDRLYMNKDDGTYPYKDMLIKEFMPFVEGKYRIKSEKKYRGISGLSMGGAGSLRLALEYNELFEACAAFSSAVFTEEEVVRFDQRNFDNYLARMSPSSVGLQGRDRLNETYKNYDPLHLIDVMDAELLKSVDIYIDCGDDDFLTLGNSQLHVDLIKKRIPHEYRVRNGGHTWNFWVESLPIGLEFISDHMISD